MISHLKVGLVLVIAGFFFFAVPDGARAGHMAISGTDDGTRVHIGFVHTRDMAQRIKHDPEVYGLHAIDGIPTGKHKYHMVVTVFDTATQARITDARVEARIAPLAFGATPVALQAMNTAGAVGYCGFFNLPPHDRYRIELLIKRRDRARVVRLRFDHEPPH